MNDEIQFHFSELLKSKGSPMSYFLETGFNGLTDESLEFLTAHAKEYMKGIISELIRLEFPPLKANICVVNGASGSTYISLKIDDMDGFVGALPLITPEILKYLLEIGRVNAVVGDLHNMALAAKKSDESIEEEKTLSDYIVATATVPDVIDDEPEELSWYWRMLGY